MTHDNGGPPEPAGRDTFYKLRAQCGGLKRSLIKAENERDAARELARDLEQHLERAWEIRRQGLDHEVVQMRTDLLHAADCMDVDCERCLRILYDLESESRYAKEDEVARKIASLESVARVAAMLVEAAAEHGPGSQRRKAQLLRALQMTLGGSTTEAETLTDG